MTRNPERFAFVVLTLFLIARARRPKVRLPAPRTAFATGSVDQVMRVSPCKQQGENRRGEVRDVRNTIFSCARPAGAGRLLDVPFAMADATTIRFGTGPNRASASWWPRVVVADPQGAAVGKRSNTVDRKMSRAMQKKCIAAE
jgi:hypothetical protein